jgi:hypothetical protein
VADSNKQKRHGYGRVSAWKCAFETQKKKGPKTEKKNIEGNEQA